MAWLWGLGRLGLVGNSLKQNFKNANNLLYFRGDLLDSIKPLISIIIAIANI
jgi:hypothetical protein